MCSHPISTWWDKYRQKFILASRTFYLRSDVLFIIIRINGEISLLIYSARKYLKKIGIIDYISSSIVM